AVTPAPGVVGGTPAGPGGPGAPAGGPGAPGGRAVGPPGQHAGNGRGLPQTIGMSHAPPRGITIPRTVSPTYRRSNLDMWAFNLQGQGAGNINPIGVNSYSALVGSIPAALIWATFHEGTSAFAVWQNVRMRVWSPAVHIHIHGDWDRIQDHFSA